MREQMAQVASAWDGTQSGMLEKQRQVAAATLAEVSKNSKEYIAIQTEMAHLDVQIRQSAGSELVAQVRASNTAINGEMSQSATQRLERERDAWTAIVSSDRLTASQRVEVQRELNQTIAALEKERFTQAQEIARADASTDIAIARMGIDAEKQALDEKLQANQISAAKKLSLLKALTTQEEQLNEQELQAELATLQKGTADYERVFNQIRELKAKLNLDLASLDRQAALDAAKLNQQQVTQWKVAVGEIENAESTMIGDLLSHRKSFAQAVDDLMQSMAQKEIENDVKAMTTRLLLANSEQASQKALEQGGFLYHLLTGQQGVAADVANQTKQTAAATAGATARTEAQTTADAAAATAAAASGLAQIKINAGVAASGAGASVAAIPLVGWQMVPAVEAATFADTMAYGAGVALEVGAWEIPRTMQATLHAGESVVPRDFASGMRAAAGSLGGGSGNSPSSSRSRSGPIQVQLDPDSMNLTLQDWLRGELAAITAGRRF
jgi:hypothetical protein